MTWLRATVIITTKDRKSYSTYKYLFYSCHGQLSAAFPNLSFLYPNPFNFSFTWAENRFLQNEIVLDFPTNIAMVSNFKYLQWKHIHMYRLIDRHTDVHTCVRTHTDRQTDMPNRDAHRYGHIPTNIFRPRRPDVVCYPAWCLIFTTPFQAEVKQKQSYNHAHCLPSVPLSCAQGHF